MNQEKNKSVSAAKIALRYVIIDDNAEYIFENEKLLNIYRRFLKMVAIQCIRSKIKCYLNVHVYKISPKEKSQTII